MNKTAAHVIGHLLFAIAIVTALVAAGLYRLDH